MYTNDMIIFLNIIPALNRISQKITDYENRMLWVSADSEDAGQQNAYRVEIVLNHGNLSCHLENISVYAV